MQRINIGGNATPTARLIRCISHGMNQLTYCNTTPGQSNAGRTFYLLKNGEIIALNEWVRKNRPEYIVAGSHGGCVGTKQRYNL